MKKLKLLALVILLYVQAPGQVWIDSGAVWHYDFWNVGIWGFYKYEYIKDTLIENHNCQKITCSSYTFTYNQHQNSVLLAHDIYPGQYTYVSGDTVFYRYNGKFFVLFNFGAGIGDSWVVAETNPFGYCDDTSRVTVTDIGNIFINSVSYRYIKVEPTSNSPLGLKGTYVERFGNINLSYNPFQLLFPAGYQCDSLTAIVDWHYFRFKCFMDNSFPLYNPSSQDCEYDLLHLSLIESGLPEIKCYPNPAGDNLYIESNITKDRYLEIYDARGFLYQTVHISSSSQKIDISDWKSGFYLIKIAGDSGNSYTKLIKK